MLTGPCQIRCHTRRAYNLCSLFDVVLLVTGNLIVTRMYCNATCSCKEDDASTNIWAVSPALRRLLEQQDCLLHLKGCWFIMVGVILISQHVCVSWADIVLVADTLYSKMVPCNMEVLHFAHSRYYYTVLSVVHFSTIVPDCRAQFGLR